MENAPRGSELSNKVLKTFQQFDQNGDGLIDKYELKQVIQKLNPSLWTDRRLTRLLNAIGRQLDGKVRYEEFVAWACSDDGTSADLKAFRDAFDISQDEGKAAELALSNGVRPTQKRSNERKPSKPSRSSTKTCLSATGRISRQEKQSVSSRSRASSAASSELNLNPKDVAVAPVQATQLETSSTTSARPDLKIWSPQADHIATAGVDDSVKGDGAYIVEPSERLIIFDYDGTITIDKDSKSKGLVGSRLALLRVMMGKIRASAARCVLVTAQFPSTTRDSTFPALETSGLIGLFQDENLDSKLSLYWDDVNHGTVYNGAKVMMGKMELIEQIINGHNCWKLAFAPADVLFVDDVEKNFRGNEKIGVKTHLVAQDGMIEQDMDVVVAFAERQG